MSTHPGITVVIPVWGEYVDDFLWRAVKSVTAQRMPGAQILIVDNHSRKAIETNTPGCAVVRTSSRLSLGEARNFGLQMVTSNYVLFLDADDELVEGSLAKLKDVLDEFPDLVAVAPEIIDRKTGCVYHWPRGWAYYLSDHAPTLFRLMETFRPMFPVNAALIRTSVAQGSPGYGASPKSAEDWVFGVSLAVRGTIRLLRVPGLIYEARQEGRWSRSTSWRDQATHRAEIRLRLRRDPAVRPIIRLLLPLLSIAHEVDVIRKANPLRSLFSLGHSK